MLTTLSILTSLGVGVFYPLTFLIHARSPIKGGFHRFHLGMPLVVGGVVFVFLLSGEFAPLTKWLLAGWFFTLALFTFLGWKKETSQPGVIVLPSLLGLLAFMGIHLELLKTKTPEQGAVTASILASLILCAALHSMTLGHHYLNAKGLPIKYLRDANNVLWGLLGIRALWDGVSLFYGSVLYGGDRISILRFLMKLDGFLLWVGIFFGTLFPLVTLYFVQEIVKIKNTQAATGILYVVLCSVLMGELTYKYYLVKFGVAL